jgi:CubicO group peptidase (beta-lactamase class C family)
VTRSHASFILPLICVALLFSLVPAQTRPQAAPFKKLDNATITTLNQRIPVLLNEASIPGLSIALIRDGKTYWLHSFGVRDKKSQQPVTDQTTFEAASLSKPVFAYGVLKLVDQGKLNLDTPLSTYLPKPYLEGDPRIDKITARIVLSHRTGFPNWRNDALAIYFTPGERFSYSGEGFVYLQKVVEQITGEPLNDYMNEAVFEPLRMASSSYVWRPDYDQRTAAPHDASGQPEDKFKPKDANAASSLQTTARDYAIFMEALMRGTGLRQQTYRDMLTAQIAVDPDCTNCTDRDAPKQLSKTVFWGLGVGLQRTKEGESFWHWGDNGSFKCYMVAYPKQKVGLVIFTNGENGLSIVTEIERLAIGGEQAAYTWIKYDAYDSPSFQFAKTCREKGAVAAIDQFRPALTRGDISEQSINSTGYQLSKAKRISDAIAVFRLNVRLHPSSANAYDSLGEAYMSNGDKEQAIENYKKSLDLNPKNTNATAMLKKLQEKSKRN